MKHVSIEKLYSSLRAELAEFFMGDGRIAVVKAPPGSGKTFTLIEVLATLVHEGKRIAVAAQTNSQADDICRRLADTHADVDVTRFSSAAYRPTDALPSSVNWAFKTDELDGTIGVVVGTTAKWSLTNVAEPFDLLAVDEAWQMSWADLMQCATVSGSFMLIGDPGQIPPVVTIDVRRWETSPRAPHEAAPDIVSRDDALADERFDGSLPACRRLPHEAVAYVKPFYDFDFEAYVEPGSRGLDLPAGHLLEALSDGHPILATLPTPDEGPPIEVDHDLAKTVASMVAELLACGALVRDGAGSPRPLTASDIGVSSTHRIMNAALQGELGAIGALVRVDTPERWQGLEKPVMIAVHPLSGVTEPTGFDLDTGRLCVMASRHQSALIIATRDHVGMTLADFIPAAEQAPGRPDIVGRGHDAHSQFWNALAINDRIVAMKYAPVTGEVPS